MEKETPRSGKDVTFEDVTQYISEVLAKVKVPQGDGSVVEKLFADCTRDELDRAIKHLKRPGSGLPEEDARLIERMRGVIAARFGGDVQLRTHDREGVMLVNLLNVPASRLVELARAIVHAEPRAPVPMVVRARR